MSVEKLQSSAENLQNIESSRERLNQLRDELDSKAEKERKETPNVEVLSKKVEQQAISGKEFTRDTETSTKQHPVLVNKQLKDMAYSRTMLRIRKHLALPERALSKVVHSKVMEKPSELAEKTIARPSGLLGGAFFAAAGSSLLLWITKHNGYTYNYLLVILLFAGGMIVGLSLEAVVRILKKR